MNANEFVSHFDDFANWCKENGGNWDTRGDVETNGTEIPEASATCEFGENEVNFKSYESLGEYTTIETENIPISKSGSFGEYPVEEIRIEGKGNDLIEEIQFNGDNIIVRGNQDQWNGDRNIDEYNEYELTISSP